MDVLIPYCEALSQSGRSLTLLAASRNSSLIILAQQKKRSR